MNLFFRSASVEKLREVARDAAKGVANRQIEDVFFLSYSKKADPPPPPPTAPFVPLIQTLHFTG